MKMSGPERLLNNLKEMETKNKRKFWIGIVFGVFVLLGLIVLLYWLIIGQFYESTDDAYVGGNLVKLMSQVDGQVEAIYADQPQWVKAGQVVIKLNSIDSELALKAAEHHLATTIRDVNQLYKNVEQSKANAKQKQSEFEIAKEDYERRTKLTLNKVITEEALRHYLLNYKAAQDAWMAAQKQLEAAEALVQNTDLYHHPNVLQAENQLRTAYLSWRRTLIYSPVSGYIAKRIAQVGQQVKTDTVLMVIVPLNTVWVDANFKETQLKNIRVGQPVALTSDIYGSSQKYKGRVVGLTPGTGSAFDLLPAQNATGNWIKILQRVPVRIQIEDPDKLHQHPLSPGLSMYVKVNTHDRSGERLQQIQQKSALYQTIDYSNDMKGAEDLIMQIIRANAENTELEKNSEKNQNSNENENEIKQNTSIIKQSQNKIKNKEENEI